MKKHLQLMALLSLLPELSVAFVSTAAIPSFTKSRRRPASVQRHFRSQRLSRPRGRPRIPTTPSTVSGASATTTDDDKPPTSGPRLSLKDRQSPRGIERKDSSNGSNNDQRTVAKLEKFARLPVWPAWNGVFLFLISKLLGEETAAWLENEWGGRVCPNFFQSEETSPFIMLVHHRHSFAPWDPLRYVQRTFFPEGFPAHPHRGFITVTYVLRGGMVHRDSLGLKQVYGAEKRHGGKHTQWLSTGAGMLHEEMWDVSEGDEGGLIPFLQPSSQELFQLWLNVPSRAKMEPPKVEIIGGQDETPTVSTQIEGGGTVTVVLAGEHGGRRASVVTESDVTILHVKMERGSTWTHRLPESHRTALIYVQKGSIEIDGTRVPPHYTAYLGATGSDLAIRCEGRDPSDFLLLAGEPLGEEIAAQGSMVMNRPDEINQAYSDYQAMKMGLPWDQNLSDEEWQEHVLRHPSMYT